MKNKYVRIYIVVIVIIIAIVAVLYSKVPKSVNWQPSFEKHKDIPYGTKYTYENLKSIFNQGKITTVNKTIYEQLKDKHEIGKNYIFICNHLELDELDMRSLLNFVADGNNVLIATNEMSYNIQDTLGFYFTVDMEIKNIIKNNVNSTSTINHQFNNPYLGNKVSYPFKDMVYKSNIAIIDTLSFKVIASDQDKKPVFISTKYGEGHLYLHAYPYAFTNYYLLFKNNQEYISKCLSVLPNTDTYWDEYYKKEHTRKEVSVNPIQFILATPALKWAWYLMLFSLLLYVAFRVKRQQRIIPILKPYENSSLQFIKTIGRLYYNKGDHQDLIKKQISYWLEYIRTKLYINTAKLDKQFIESVAEKSGLPIHTIEEIIYMISEMRNGQASKKEVVRLYEKLEYFYTHSKR